MVARLHTIRRKLAKKQKLGFSERARAVNKGLIPVKKKRRKDNVLGICSRIYSKEAKI